MIFSTSFHLHALYPIENIEIVEILNCIALQEGF